MPEYQPEVGQFLFGNLPGAFEVPTYATAMVLYLLDEVERIFGNRNQREWDRYENPAIKGVTFRPYWWGDEDAPESELPNLQFEDVEVRWYKHPGRGMSVNRELSASEWAAWFDRCLEAVLADDAPVLPRRGVGQDG